MMAKVSLNNLANLQNETSAVSIINANNDAIEVAMENTLSRDGTQPNKMASEFDMDGNRILNLPSPIAETEPVRLVDLLDAQLNPGDGNVLGPASAISGNVAVFAGTSGKAISDGGIGLTALAPKTSPTFTGTVNAGKTVITSNVAQGSPDRPLTLNNNASAGDFIRFVNSNATNGSKYFRIDGAGAFQIINSAYSAAPLTVSDAGLVTATSYAGDGTSLTGVETSSHAASTYSPITRQVNGQSGTTYTLVLTDAGKLVFLGNASPVTCTIPNSSTVAFPSGTQIDFIQYGAGKTTFASASGVTIVSLNSNKALLGQYAACSIIYNGSNVWYLFGSLQA